VLNYYKLSTKPAGNTFESFQPAHHMCYARAALLANKTTT